MQEELAAITCAANESEAQREQELSRLNSELEVMYRDQHAYEKEGAQDVKSETSMLRSFFESDADQLHEELNGLKFENL